MLPLAAEVVKTMHSKQLEKFLSQQSDVPQDARDTILRSHAGRWPTWSALTIQRVGSEIVEVAKWCRYSHGNRYVVLWWNITRQTIGVKWHSCGTLREAMASTERMHSPHAANVEVSG